MTDASRTVLGQRLRSVATRRAAVGGFGAGVAALAVRSAMAQDATPLPSAPEATPTADAQAALLFIQQGGQSTVAPGTDGAHTLTMSGASAQTLYFSNRPGRLTGAVPTETFVAGFGALFGDVLPNASLIGHATTGADAEDVLVVTLSDPTWDAASSTLTYRLELLGAESVADGQFESEPISALDAAREYAEVHLFIDDVTLSPMEQCQDACRPLLPNPQFDPMGIGHAAWLNCYIGCMSKQAE